MLRLSFLILTFSLISLKIAAQSQHGESFSIDCAYCHDEESWNVEPQKVTFDHSSTNFSLIGQHKNIDCRSCHTSLTFKDTKRECISCHTDIHTGSTGADCSSCHTPETWIVKDIINIHQNSRFPLAGNHKTADCQQCHSGYTELNFDPIGVNCIDCHILDYNATTSPNHITAGFSTDCYSCHSINAITWNTTNVIHDFFPLVGGHNITNCFACHDQGGNFTGLSADCYSCHEEDYNATQNPNHIQAQFSTDCKQCHNINAFVPASFDHNLTDFPLTGRHITVNCQNCHSSGYTGTPTECMFCHENEFNSTTNPNHIAAGFPITCNDCHTTASWQPAQFDHDGLYFPIYSGEHRGEWNECTDCHTIPNNYSIFSCIDCHEHNKTDMDDEHQNINGYIYESTACLSCHPNGDKEGAFNHNISIFKLEGAHNSLDCSQCHQNGYAGTSTVCYDCHTNDYNNSLNPNHTVLSIPTDCNTCHSTLPGWSPATFSLHDNYFILTGRHLEIINDCSSCHNGNFNNISGECISCHQSDYEQALNPNHQAAGISTECSGCHNFFAWIPSNFDHNTTGFQLTGQHLNVECSACHQGTTSGLTNNCYNCHTDDYNSAPLHLNQSLPTSCELCHNTSVWTQVSFDHQTTGFPLTGAHSNTQCSACHQNGYSGTPVDCISCHTDDYNSTTNPNHLAAGFPVTCQDCHSTNAWQPAQFDHDAQYFPIYSGKHKDKWNTCSDCHTIPNNFSLFSCIDCHEHNQIDMDKDHSEVPGYVYQSTACLSCHPSGNKLNRIFEFESEFDL